MRARLIPALIAFAVVGVIGGAAYFVWKTYPWVFSGRYSLQIATGPLSDHAGKFFAAFKRELAHEHPRVRLALVETPSLAASANAFKNGEVEAAVARGDNPAAAEGRAVFVLRKLYLVVLVPAHSSIDSMSGLKGHKIGVLARGTDEIDPMAKAVLDFYGFDDKHVVRLPLKELSEALQGKRIAGLMAVGPIGPGVIADAVQVFRKSSKKPPTFIELPEAEAISERYPVYDNVEMPDGAIDTSPIMPPDDITTIAVNVVLVAQQSLSNYAAGELTRLLLATKSKIAAAIPEAGQLAAPSTDLDAVLPAHPGTIAFLNGDQPDLLDESMNYIYLGSILTGALGSLAAWATSLRNRNKLRDLQSNIERLPSLLSEARATPGERLDAIEEELEALSEWFVEKFVSDEISPETFTNASTRMSYIRALVEKRRAGRGASPPAPVLADKQL
jgi:TRAP-type uncharacterized transport system substrate-binding protein